MNIFYSQTSLNDNLVALVNSASYSYQIQVQDDIIFLNEQDEIVGFNISKISITTKLANGRLFLTDDIKSIIKNRFKDYNLAKIDSGFVVAKIIECEDIEGTHLHNCLVDVGNDKLKIVCGAKNAKVGLVTVLAKLNTIMNSGLEIKASKLKGFDSYGMLCSQKELCLDGFNNEGIIELNEQEYKIGEIFKPMYKNL